METIVTPSTDRLTMLERKLRVETIVAPSTDRLAMLKWKVRVETIVAPSTDRLANVYEYQLTYQLCGGDAGYGKWTAL